MTALVASWTLAVAVLLIGVTRPWRSAQARAPLPFILAVAVAGWVIWNGAAVYADLMAQHSWTAATIVIPYVPAKAALLMLLTYFAARSLLALRTSTETAPSRYTLPAVLTAITLTLLANDVLSTMTAAKVRTARNLNLTTEQLAVVTARVTGGAAQQDEILAFLENPLCPPALLEKYATEHQYFKTQITRNPKVPTDLLLRLSKDPDPIVRYYAAASSQLPPEELSRLSSDDDAMVREMIAWKDKLSDEDFQRLINDSAARVRATVALQPRLADADLLRLTTDADASVRANAARIAVQRGLKE